MIDSSTLVFRSHIQPVCFISLKRFPSLVPVQRGASLLRCHFCGNQLSLAQALELQEGEGYFYVCEHCAMSLDPLRLKQGACYRCAGEGTRNRSVATCDMCKRGICAGHHIDMQPESPASPNRRISMYEPALMMPGGKRRVLCDVCAAALGEEEEG